MTEKRWYEVEEVAVHLNGQTAMRKEVADSNLYECQPPLPLRASFFIRSGRGGCLSILINSHLFHFVPPLFSGEAEKEVADWRNHYYGATSFPYSSQWTGSRGGHHFRSHFFFPMFVFCFLP
jgi:hypothetical protein